MTIQGFTQQLHKWVTLLALLSLFALPVLSQSGLGAQVVEASLSCNPNLNNLPAPVLQDHPNWVALYNKSWELAKLNIHTGSPPLTPCWIDEAYSNNYTNQWDIIFIQSFARYGYYEFPSIEGMENFYVGQEANGRIQRVFRENNGNQMYGLNPPVFAWGEWQHYLVTGDQTRFTKVIPTASGNRTILNILVNYYNWVKNDTLYHHADGTYAWPDLTQSGMDNTPSYTYSAVDLILEQTVQAYYVAQIAGVVGDTATQTTFMNEYNALKSFINTKHWDSVDGFYYNVNSDGTFQRIKSVQGLWSMISGVASPAQVASQVNHITNPNEFWRVNPMPSLSADAVGYDPGGGYWKGSNWSPTTYMTVKGLEANGYEDLATALSIKHIDVMSQVFANTGTIWENYAPDLVAPGNRAKPDFVGWTALGPVAMLIENVLGFRVNAPADAITWNLSLVEEHGIQNLHFGNNIATLISARRASTSDGARLTITTNSPFNVTVKVVGGQTCNQAVGAGTTTFDCGTFSGGPTPTAGPSATATNTPSGPTNTPTRTNTPTGPTNTPTATPTRTNTPIGPTNTPTPTNTSAPATATNTPSGGTNLALNKPATVSSFSSVNQDGTEAVDGNVTTYWRTLKGSMLTAEWIVVDLGSNTSISSVTLKWATYWATVYDIQVSTDSVNWTTKFSTSSGDGGTDSISFASSTARYVRMYSTNWNHATERLRLNEIEIYQ